MEEVLWVYGSFLFFYPWFVLQYAMEDPIPFVVWLGLGLAVTFVLLRLAYYRIALVLSAAWFMPGTIICGAASLVPWPFAVWSAVKLGYCVRM